MMQKSVQFIVIVFSHISAFIVHKSTLLTPLDTDLHALAICGSVQYI